MAEKKNWIQDALKDRKPGTLHRALKVPMGKKIPMGKLQAAAKKPGVTGRRARLALTLRNIQKGNKKKK